MSLTEKQKRFIISPHSFSSKQQRNHKYEIKKKISQITQDFEFITKHREEISQILGDSIPTSNDMIVPESENPPNISDKDPDFL